MLTQNNFFKKIGGKRLFCLLTILLLTTTLISEKICAQEESKNKTKTIRRVVEYLIKTGNEEYEQGMYVQAEKTYLQALDYKESLTKQTREQLGKLLDSAHSAVQQRKEILKQLKQANKLIEQGELLKAKQGLSEISGNKFLREGERKYIQEALKKLNKKLKDDKSSVFQQYTRSRQLYRAGKLEEAQQGFNKIVESDIASARMKEQAKGYLSQIRKEMSKGEEVTEDRIPQPTPDRKAKQAPAKIDRQGVMEFLPERGRMPNDLSPVEQLEGPNEGTYISDFMRKRNIRRNYTRTVLNDTVEKVQKYFSEDKFSKARNAVDYARKIVQKYRVDLGEQLFTRYMEVIDELSSKIESSRQASKAQLTEKRKEAAQKSQKQYAAQREAERQERITELLENARAYTRRQRYEEALGQLELLLELAPQHDEALTLKQILEDNVSFRKQRQVHEEARKERAKLLTKVEESSIPYAEELTYPKNWDEIAAKRKPEEVAGESPENRAVYDQLEKVVNLSELSPQMTFSAALDLIRNSVDPPLKIVVLWRDLRENADVTPTTPINMDPISSAPVGTALELLLKSVSLGYAELSYIVEKGVITIATTESLPSEMVTRVYDVTDLLGQKAQYFGAGGMMMGMGMGMGGGGGGMYGGGGGMYGGGGMGGYGGGGYGGGMGGYGGGMGGYGGGGYGGMGMGGGYGGGMGGYGQQYMEFNLIRLIQDTVEPETWWEAGGDGTINMYEGKKLIIRQTPDVQKRVEKLLNEMRKALGHQIAIEARFLVVTENFLEDIGLDLNNFSYQPGGHWDTLTLSQDTSEVVRPSSTKVPGSLGGTVEGLIMEGGWGWEGLDDLQVDFILRAVQAHKDSRTLTAPKVTVLSGESASFNVTTNTVIALPPVIGQQTVGGGVSGISTAESIVPNIQNIMTGSVLNIMPVITRDKKHVLLNIITTQMDFLGLKSYNIQTPLPDSDQVAEYTQELPETESSQVMTRVSVPDKGTLLLGGQKITAETETEAGVPILSKIPGIGRLFTNKSQIKDNRILLILVKPTIILQEERDAEAEALSADKF